MNSARQIASSPRISFGMIVLNGEPFTRHNILSIYPWAHEIIVVEGACLAAANVADDKGHSSVGTLEVLRRFQVEEDCDHKVMIVTAEDEGHPNGFWPGEKLEMSQAYARRATGNCLWQVDVDEFYLEEDMPRIIRLLEQGADVISFPAIHFWGGIHFVQDGEYQRVHNGRESTRLFRWGPGFRYSSHRPPTVLNDNGINLKLQRSMGASELESQGVFMYHYSMLIPKQVREKCSYYARADWGDFPAMEKWAVRYYFHLGDPFAVCNVPNVPLSWLEEYHGPHPSQISIMSANIRAGKYPGIELRLNDDIWGVIRTRPYRLGRLARKSWVHSGLPWIKLKVIEFAARLLRGHGYRKMDKHLAKG